MLTATIRLLASFCLVALLAGNAYPLAFPTAVGLGKNTVGGRGGTVIKVTNLNDSGPGSLRAALATSGPRIIVFTVSGNIDLTSLLYVTEPYVTIAGQTSPGGISVSGKQFNIATHDVIVRHMRFRAGGHRYTGSDSDGDSFCLWGPGWTDGAYPIYNVIIDHCSMTWGVDETFSISGGATNVTLQYNLIAQGLQYAKNGAPNQHSKGLMVSGKVNPGDPGWDTTVSIYRNFMPHNEDRSPMMFNPPALGSTMILDGVNNVIYNAHIRSIVGGDAHVNWIGNYFRDGTWTSAVNSLVEMQATASEPLLYVTGNVGVRKSGAVFKDASAADWPFVTTQYPFNPVSSSPYQSLTRWATDVPLTAQPMTAALAAEIVAASGASRVASAPGEVVRDSVDAAIINSYTAGTDLRLTTVSYPSDWPVYDTSNDNPTDTDNDGMPDTWEVSKGLNPNVANADLYTMDGSYTNIEMYLNELAGDTPTTVYYVSPTGSATNDGASPSTPWNLAKVNSFSFAAGDTVRFASGDYGTTALAPKSNGTAAKPITFTYQLGAATKPIFRGGVNLNGRSYIKIEGLDLTSSGTTVSMSGASYNTVTKCNIYSTTSSWSPALSLKNGAHYNKITNNTISQNSGNNDIINLRNDADNNLIEGNSITIQNNHAAIDLEGYTIDTGGSRVGDGTSNWNIIRGNTITGHNGGGAHITLQANANYNTVDNNTLKGDSTLSGYCNLTYPSTQFSRHQGIMKGVGNYNIIRNNILADYPCKDSLGLTMAPYVYGDGFVNNTRYAHVYSNVITGVGVGATPLYLFKNDAATHDNNYFKNNILLNNGGTYWQTDVDGSLPSDTGNLQMRDDLSSNFFTNNIIYKSGYAGALVWLGSNRYTVDQANTNSANWDGNLSVDPQLDSDYLPQTGSPALNAGANLTTITSASGSGTSFAVADAYYFSDGNGITTGDTIKVGEQTATITDISYGAGLTGTLTVTPSITWTQGDAVNLNFTGTAPHIGLSRAIGGGNEPDGDETIPPTSTPSVYCPIRANVR